MRNVYSPLDIADGHRLRKLNLITGAVFTWFSILLLIDAMLDTEHRVTVYRLAWTRQLEGGFHLISQPYTHDVNIKLLSVVFCALAAVDHLIVASPCTIHTYESCLTEGCNPFRWAEYTVSCTTMNLLIAMLSGVLDVQLLVAVASLTVTCMFFGFLGEIVSTRGLSITVFSLGCVPFIAAWSTILVSFGNSIQLSDRAPPDFVYAIATMLLVMETAFGVNQILPFSSYVQREEGFIYLSLVSKTTLAALTWGGIQSLKQRA